MCGLCECIGRIWHIRYTRANWKVSANSNNFIKTPYQNNLLSSVYEKVSFVQWVPKEEWKNFCKCVLIVIRTALRRRHLGQTSLANCSRKDEKATMFLILTQKGVHANRSKITITSEEEEETFEVTLVGGSLTISGRQQNMRELSKTQCIAKHIYVTSLMPRLRFFAITKI